MEHVEENATVAGVEAEESALVAGVEAEESAPVTGVEAEEKFFFALQADEHTLTELRFLRDAPRVIQVLITACGYINSTFDQPFNSTGDFLRAIADTSDEIDTLLAKELGDGEQPN